MKLKSVEYSEPDPEDVDWTKPRSARLGLTPGAQDEAKVTLVIQGPVSQVRALVAQLSREVDR